MLAFYLAQVEEPEDRAYFAQVYWEYKDKLFNIARGIVDSDLLADEAVHDTFVKLIGELAEFRRLGDTAQKGWLTVVVEHIALNIRNKEKRSIPMSSLDWLTEKAEIGAEEPVNWLALEIQGLPERYRTVLELYYLWGYSVKEIAAQLELSESNVKQRLRRARQMLRERLEENEKDNRGR